jgi:carboxyl-terminal processing protease
MLQFKKYDDLGALKVTIQKFYRVTGGSTQYKGVEPDIVLPSLFQHLKSGEKYLEYSLPWDQVDPVAFTPFSGKPLDIEMIRNKSMQRVEHDEGLKIIAEEAKKADERSKQTAVSLKLSDMRKKMEQARVEREKVGAQYRKYQGLEDDEPSDMDRKDMKKGDIPDWKEEIRQDPYIGEARHIIVDMEK